MNSKTRQRIIETLKINIDLFIKDLREIQDTGVFDEFDENIIGLCLLGNSCPQIAEELLSNRSKKAQDNIRGRLSTIIYPRIVQLMKVEQQQVKEQVTKNWAKWAKILSFLLNPNNNYKLNPPPQLNDDNFQSSFGNQFFMLSGD